MRSSLITSGNTLFEVIPTYQRKPILSNIFRGLFPHGNISREVAQWRRRNVYYALPGFVRYLRSLISGNPYLLGSLSFSLVDPNGKETDFGLVSLDLITNVGANAIVDGFLGTVTLSNFRYHALGSSTSGLAVTNITLAAELGSSYITTNLRTAASMSAGTSNNILVSIASTSFVTTVACAEWGLFSQSSVLAGTPAGGTLFDRATFATQNVLATFAAKTTYTLTVASGS